MSRQANIITKVIALVLAVGLIAGTVSVVYKYTDGFNEDFKTFYVEYNGKQILTETSEITLAADTEPKFTVKYTFDGRDGKRDYTVKIVPNAFADFEYTADGQKYLYSKTGDLTEAFGVIKQDAYFTLTLTRDMNVQTVLQCSRANADICVPTSVNELSHPYVLVVSSYNGKVTYNIKFGISGVDKVYDANSPRLTLNVTAITF